MAFSIFSGPVVAGKRVACFTLLDPRHLTTRRNPIPLASGRVQEGGSMASLRVNEIAQWTGVPSGEFHEYGIDRANGELLLEKLRAKLEFQEAPVAATDKPHLFVSLEDLSICDEAPNPTTNLEKWIRIIALADLSLVVNPFNIVPFLNSSQEQEEIVEVTAAYLNELLWQGLTHQAAMAFLAALSKEIRCVRSFEGESGKKSFVTEVVDKLHVTAFDRFMARISGPAYERVIAAIENILDRYGINVFNFIRTRNVPTRDFLKGMAYGFLQTERLKINPLEIINDIHKESEGITAAAIRRGMTDSEKRLASRLNGLMVGLSESQK